MFFKYLLKEFKIYKAFLVLVVLLVLPFLLKKEVYACPIDTFNLSITGAGCTVGGVTINLQASGPGESAGQGIQYSISAVDAGTVLGNVSGTESDYTCTLSPLAGDSFEKTLFIPFSRAPTGIVFVSGTVISPGALGGRYIMTDSITLQLAQCDPQRNPNGTACSTGSECQSYFCDGGICACITDGTNVEAVGGSCGDCCSGGCTTGTRTCITRVAGECSDIGEDCSSSWGKPCCVTGSVECRYMYSAPGGSLCQRKTSGTCKSWGNICGGAGDTTCCNDSVGNTVNCVATIGGRYQCGGDTFDWGIPPPIEYSGPILNLEEIIRVLYRILFPVGIAFGAFMVIKSGYAIMTSEGNPTKVMEAKEDLTSAIIGLLFVLLSAVILRVIISSLLGADI